MVRIASTASLVPLCTERISRVVSPVAFAVCTASDFTSEATTANHAPASPARAASMVALSARRSSWPAMSWMGLAGVADALRGVGEGGDVLVGRRGVLGGAVDDLVRAAAGG